MPLSDHPVGSSVVLTPDAACLNPHLADRVWTVARHLRTNLELKDARGVLLRVRPDEVEQGTCPNGPARSTARVEEIPMPLHLGQVVTVSHPRWKHPADALWVNIDISRNDREKLAMLGSNPDKPLGYFMVPREWCTIVDPSRIVVTPA